MWSAFDDWRWIPPSGKRIQTADYDLIVTPGSATMTFAFGLKVDPPARAEEVLDDLRARILAEGGKGVRLQVTPQSRPLDLPERLGRRGYKPRETAELLVWELKDLESHPRLPEFRAVDRVVVREVEDDREYDAFQGALRRIFGDPEPLPETQAAFRADFRRQVREEGHSGRFLAWEGEEAVGAAGMQVVPEVARLWGSGVLPERRGRGIYGALVRARCEQAERRGCEVALVVAREGTSGPILKRHGWRTMGPVRLYQAEW